MHVILNAAKDDNEEQYMKISIVFLPFLILLLILPTGCCKKTSLDWFVCDKSELVFDDGDSFSCGDEEIRVLGIDTPEITHPDHGIFKNQPMGRKTAAFTNRLLQKAERIVIVRGGKGGYGRTLAHVIIDGRLLGVELIRAGLAYANIARYGDNGLPEFALQITEAAKTSPKPKFEDPHMWRRKNQRR